MSTVVYCPHCTLKFDSSSTLCAACRFNPFFGYATYYVHTVTVSEQRAEPEQLKLNFGDEYEARVAERYRQRLYSHALIE